jgi:glycine oxidase
MKAWDAIIIGGGVIGLSLAIELRRIGLSVIVLDRQQPGHEASWAAGGMLADAESGSDPAFCTLATESARMYPDFVHRLQDESGIMVDLREQGTIRFLDEPEHAPAAGVALSAEELKKLEPQLEYSAPAVFLPERCVDPRLLINALIGAAKHLGIDVSSGAEVTGLEIEDDAVVGVLTTKSRYSAGVVVNCAGAWAAGIGPLKIPTIPVKGQMLAVTPASVNHVVRGNGVYLIPRSNGRLVIGATVEDAGFDKRVTSQTIQRLHQAAAILAPSVGQARILEDWAGLRPGTSDRLPIMGPTNIRGYYVSTGHYRDGILLAPISAHLIARVIKGDKPTLDLSAFSLERFA